VIPIFVGGTGRSGTSITLDLLGQHSEFYATSPLEVTVLTCKDGLLDCLEKGDIKNFDNTINNLWFDKINRSHILDGSIEKNKIYEMLEQYNKDFFKNKNEATKTFYYNFFKNQKLFKDDAIYIGDSTPLNIRYAHRINKIFPDAKFIHMIRDGRDAAFSMYLMREYFNLTGNKTEFDALDWWYERIVQSFISLNSLNTNQYISIRLENLAINKKEESFLGLLNFLNLKKEEKIEKYFDSTVKENNINIGLWEKMNNYKEFDKKYDQILLKLKEQDIFIEKYY
jgi:hypothetical protein